MSNLKGAFCLLEATVDGGRVKAEWNLNLRNKYLLFPTYRVCSRGDVLRLTITYLNVWYLSPVRGSRTFAWAEKTMKETLILGLKGRKIFTPKCENLLKLQV